MADLLALLVQSGNSLSAHSTAVATAGNNVANANTPGYSRQIANLVANQATALMGVGSGVMVASITQARNQFVERQIPNALAAQASSQGESNALQSVSALNPDLEGGLTSALGAFYSSLRTLTQDPGDNGARQAVLGASQALARSFNQTVSSIEDARTGLDSQIEGDVNQVNNAAQSLVDFNKQIRTAQALGRQPNDLLDARQTVIDTLAKLTGATPYTNAAGDVSMALAGGTALVTDGGASQLSAVADPANSGHLMLRLTRFGGSGAIDVPSSSLGGEIGGLHAARDGAMKTAVTAIDTLAFDFANAVNTVHQAGFAMDGTPGQSLFTIPVSASGAASQIAVNATVASDPRLLAAATTFPAASGDNRNILALIATEQQALAGGSDPVTSLQQITTNFGTSSAHAQAFAAHDGAMATSLINLRDSTSGVSVDEEMINLTKAQKAFEAVSRVIATADAMLETLMGIK